MFPLQHFNVCTCPLAVRLLFSYRVKDEENNNVESREVRSISYQSAAAETYVLS